MVAAERGSLEVFRELINAGADPCYRDNIRSSIGQTTLHHAAKSANESVEIVRWIVKSCPTFINLTDRFGNTPLHLAASLNNKEVCQQLLSASANTEEVDFMNRTPLWIATKKGHYQIVELLINFSSNPNHQDFKGEAVIHAAIINGNLSIIHFLLNNSANVSLKDHYGKTCLMLAAEFGTVEIMELLLDHEANPNDEDNEGNPVYFYTIFSRESSVEKMRTLTQFSEKKNEWLKFRIEDGISYEKYLYYSDEQRKKNYLRFMRMDPSLWPYITLPSFFQVNTTSEYLEQNKVDALVVSAREGSFNSLKFILNPSEFRGTYYEANNPLHYAIISKVDPIKKVYLLYLMDNNIFPSVYNYNKSNGKKF